MLREYPLAQAFTLELFRGRASQEERAYRPGMVPWQAAAGRKEAGAGCSGDRVCRKGVCACKLLPRAQPARVEQVPSPPHPGDAALQHPQNTWTWTQVSAWTPAHLQTRPGATEAHRELFHPMGK